MTRRPAILTRLKKSCVRLFRSNAGTPSCNASFAASNLNKQLFPDRKYTVLQTAFNVTRPITQQMTANLSYAYIRETQKNIYFQGSSPTYDDSRIWISIQYTWNHPLGR